MFWKAKGTRAESAFELSIFPNRRLWKRTVDPSFLKQASFELTSADIAGAIAELERCTSAKKNRDATVSRELIAVFPPFKKSKMLFAKVVKGERGLPKGAS